jgi:aspartate/methionine/tyrosine aminotransferase
LDYLGGLNDLTMAKYSSKKLPPEAKAVLVVNPNNPTGNFIGAEERQSINHFCATGKASIISDEVFLDYAYAKSGESFAGNEKALTFTLSGISKILGLPQMKLSWIVVSGPAKLRDEALQRLEVILDTYLSVGSPVQNALPGWLAKKDKPIHEILKRVTSNRETIKKKLGAKAHLASAQGGWYAVLYSEAIKDEESFVLELLEKQDVLIHPGFFYDFEQTGHVVLSLLPDHKTFEKGIGALAKAF